MLAEKPVEVVSEFVGETPKALTAIYQDNCNLAVWQQGVTKELVSRLSDSLVEYAFPSLSSIVEPAEARALIMERYHDLPDVSMFADHVALLVDMFCCLFDLKAAGLRLKKLDTAMCPKFHVDHVPCRLVVTYCGVATQWLAEANINRQKLGIASAGLSDEQAGIYNQAEAILQLNTGDVALLKGEKWLGNEGQGVVHRSPVVSANSSRIVLTLDFAR